jgi:AmmeMemoRadiSam system protein B
VDRYFALTRKHFETPFGPARCDLAFMDALAQRLGDAAYDGELAHRDEHSLELQTLYLKRRLGERPFAIVPVLFGGFHGLAEEAARPDEEPEIESFIQALREVAAAQGGPTCYVAAVDLSHVGARFGETGTLDEDRLKALEQLDRQAVEAARTGSANAWFEVIAEHRDSTQICGYGPVYAMLRCAEPGEGRLLRYEQSLEASGSMVSYAAMAWS